MEQGIRWERGDGVLEVILDRPEKRNALTVEMYAALAEAFREGEEDPEVRVFLLSGAGAGFTAGNDLHDFLRRPPQGEGAPVHEFLNALVSGRKPIVAAVHGFAVGIGTTLLLHCDLVYAAEGTRFHLPFVALGLVPEAASSLLLPWRVGWGRAAEMLLLGEPIGAEEAREAGLVTGVYPEPELHPAARERAVRLARLPREALQETRRLLRPDPATVRARMRIESERFEARLRSVEARSAMEAFFRRD